MSNVWVTPARSGSWVSSACLVLLLSLLLAMLLPALDHHFVERTPGHGHVTLGAVQTPASVLSSHLHPFQHNHVHHSSNQPPQGLSGPAEQTPQLFFLPGSSPAATVLSFLSETALDAGPRLLRPVLLEAAHTAASQRTPLLPPTDVPSPPPRLA